VSRPVLRQTVLLQVRAVCVGDIGVITTSRDTTIKVWAEDGPTSYSLVHTLVRDDRLV